MFGSPPAELSRLPGDEHDPDRDDTLTLLLLCCHPALTPPSQIALTLRAVGGLTTAEIARRVLRARSDHGAADQPGQAAIRQAGATFSMPPPDEIDERLRTVLHVLYLIFNEGYTDHLGRPRVNAPTSPPRRSG